MTVDFPQVSDSRPTTPTLTRILADAAESVSGDLRERVLGSRAWRSDYVPLLAELTTASAAGAAAARTIAARGLASARRNMVWADGAHEIPLDAVELGGGAQWLPTTATVSGRARRVTQLSVPYRGRELSGAQLLEQLDTWVADGVAEPSFRDAIARVVAHPEWLALPGRRVALLGAGAELSPLAPLSAWGAEILAVDVPVRDVWLRIADTAQDGAGKVRWPLRPDGAPGMDVTTEIRELAAWLRAEAGSSQLVVGMYAYADRGMHVRLTMATDLLATYLCAADPRTALAYLATPTDAFVVPAEVVAAGRKTWRERGPIRYLDAAMRRASRDRLFRPSYPSLHADGTGLADILVPQQGPSYALAKRLQRWRGVLAEQQEHAVSFNVAPASWTRSVTRNRALAAAYRGAHRFDIEVFEPDTCRVLMAALLVHDLNHRRDPRPHPEALFSDQALHGGLWRAGYEPKSALGFAALLGTLDPRSALRARPR
ncbi:hypothetical protein IRT45_09595 [Nocardia sp. BSTN01]|uniref:hypothetical protein n=1 Tax=Nocardia sp. BSTN01 TaxID=2783665 RepID=UPI00188F0321|nr:hypothetical protein [Nocardia sp. BSTN01]MBF4997412.1 hypothetical protein [Nocardia sp. BSTN01]